MVCEGYQMLAFGCKYIEPSEMQYLIGRHHVYFVLFRACLDTHRPSFSLSMHNVPNGPTTALIPLEIS